MCHRYSDFKESVAEHFSPVLSEVWEFEVSGLGPLIGWLDYRIKDSRDQRSSPLEAAEARENTLRDQSGQIRVHGKK